MLQKIYSMTSERVDREDPRVEGDLYIDEHYDEFNEFSDIEAGDTGEFINHAHDEEVELPPLSVDHQSPESFEIELVQPIREWQARSERESEVEERVDSKEWSVIDPADLEIMRQQDAERDLQSFDPDNNPEVQVVSSKRVAARGRQVRDQYF